MSTDAAAPGFEHNLQLIPRAADNTALSGEIYKRADGILDFADASLQT